MSKKTITSLVSICATVLALPLVASALTFPTLGDGAAIDPVVLFDAIFNFLWPLFTIIAVLLFITAGYMFMTANGEASKIKTAKDALLWGVAGVIVAIMAFSIPTIIQGVLGGGA